MMTVEMIHESIREIEQLAGSGDHEAAHAREDALHRRVLLAISIDDCSNALLCAAEALSTIDIVFERHCA